MSKLQTTQATAVTDGANNALAERTSIQALLSKESVRKRFEEMLGRRAAGFMSSIINLVNSDVNLQKCDPRKVLGCAAVAASMDLPIDRNLGFAWIIPYENKKTNTIEPQFQMGYKGFIQLALRTGQYKTIHAAEVYEGEIKSYNRFTGEIEFDPEGRKSDKIVGYVAYFKLINGFEKYHYMTVEQIRAHAKRYSKGYGQPWSRWTTDFEAMALKTVIKLLLSKYGILSIEMQMAMKADQAAVVQEDDGEFQFEYPDSTVVESEYTVQHGNGDAADLNARLAQEPDWDEIERRTKVEQARLM